MAITRGAVRKIIELVDADPECKSRIDDFAYTGRAVSQMGWAGSERNIYIMMTDVLITAPLGGAIQAVGNQVASRMITDDPKASVRDRVGSAIVRAGQRVKDFEESNIERLTCTGIASAVDRVLSTARALKEVRGLSRSGPLSREMPAHTANEIFMTDGSQYVLDFHASLDIHAPMISTAADWLAHKKGWRYREDGTIPSLITFLRDDPAPDGID